MVKFHLDPNTQRLEIPSVRITFEFHLETIRESLSFYSSNLKFSIESKMKIHIFRIQSAFEFFSAVLFFEGILIDLPAFLFVASP